MDGQHRNLRQHQKQRLSLRRAALAAVEALEGRQLLSGGTTFLSDMDPRALTGGFGDVEMDRSNGNWESGDGQTMAINGAKYRKGLGTHSGSDLRYALNGRYETFRTDIGVDDEVLGSGSVDFQIWADGNKLYDSGEMTGRDAARHVAVDIAGVNELRLVVTDAGDGNINDHADWADARITAADGSGNGLKGEYFNGTDLSDHVMSRTDPRIQFNWVNGSPDGRVNNDYYSVRWTGQVETVYDNEVYTFYTTSDDGVRLWIDGQLLINNWSNHAPTVDQATIKLGAGKHDIKLTYYEATVGSTIQLQWSSDSQPLQVVPQHHLYSDAVSAEEANPAPQPAPQPTPQPPQIRPAAGANTIVVGPRESVRSIQQAIDMAQPGQTVLVRNGTYRESITVNRSGQPGKPIMIAAEDTGGVIIDGSGRSFAINGQNARNIVLKGIRIVNTNSGIQAYNAALKTGPNWWVEDVTVERSAGCGIGIFGADATFVRTYANYNGQIGWGGLGDRSFLKDSGAVGNNTRNYNAAWESGGVKFYMTNGVTVDGGTWANNGGPGIWFDYKNRNYTVRNTDVYANNGAGQNWAGVGIVGEISDGPGLIEDNYVHDNTGDGIAVWESFDVTVRDNKLVHDNIGWRNMPGRGYYSQPRNNTVYNNVFFGGQVNTPPKGNSAYGNRNG